MKVFAWGISLATDYQKLECLKAGFKEDLSLPSWDLLVPATKNQKVKYNLAQNQKTLPLTGSDPTSKARTALDNLFCFQNMAVFQAWITAGHNPCWPLHAKVTISRLSLFHMTMPQTLEHVVKYLLHARACVIFGHHQSPYTPGEVSSHWGFSWTKHFENSSWKASQFICVGLIDQTNVVPLLRVGNQAA